MTIQNPYDSANKTNLGLRSALTKMIAMRIVRAILFSRK